MPARYSGHEVWSEAAPPRSSLADSRLGVDLSASWLTALYDTPLLLCGLLDCRGVLIDGNQALIEGCEISRGNAVGRSFWNGGWWSPDPRLADQVRRWCERIVATHETLRVTTRFFTGSGSSRMVDLSLYPISEARLSRVRRPGCVDGDPIDGGSATYIVVSGMDVTESLVARAENEEKLNLAAELLQREAEVQNREIAALSQAERLVRHRLGRLAAAAVDMVGANSIDELTSIVFNQAFPIIEAAGGALVIRDSTELRVHFSERLNAATRAKYENVPSDSPYPGHYVARTGLPLLLPTRESGIAFLPEMAEVYESTERHAWAYFPLKRRHRVLGSLAIAWEDERSFTDDEVALMESIAAQCSETIERIEITALNDEHTRQIEHMVESMQRSLLTPAPTGDDLDIATTYVAAAQPLQVGGDWYDAFTTGSGETVLVVGDVTGHDSDSAAKMAQLRNLLRGLAIGGNTGPASLLSQLDATISALGLDVVATLSVIGISPRSRSDESGRVLLWSSAGHPPPLVRHLDGSVVALSAEPDLLLGVDPSASRVDHALELPRGSTLVMYSDGLVERRGEHLDSGLDRLAATLAGAKYGDAQQLCKTLVAEMVPGTPEDDIVVLAATLAANMMPV